MGGVFNSINLDAYHYAGDNPVKMVDPDGNDLIAIVFPRGADDWGHAAGILVEKKKNKKETYGVATIYEQGNWGNTSQNNKEKIRKHTFKTKIKFDENDNPTLESITALLKEVYEYRTKVKIDDVQSAYIKTTQEQDQKIKEYSEARYNKPADEREDYSKYSNNCLDFLKGQCEAAGIDTPSSPFPKSAIKSFQKNNIGYDYNYKTQKVNKTE